MRYALFIVNAMVDYSCQHESGIDNRHQSAIMQVADDGRAGRRCIMAVCLPTLESDSSVLDLFSMPFGNNDFVTANRDTVEFVQWQNRYHHDGHHQRTNGSSHTPFPVRLHFTCNLFPRGEDVKFDPLLRSIPERWRGNQHKREDGVSADSNEVARHAHAKWFTGADLSQNLSPLIQ